MPKAAGVADVSHNACPATHTYSDLNLHTFFQSKKRIEIVYICMSFDWLGLWPALDTTPAYVGHNTYLRRPQHLLTSASALTCVGHNTSHLHRPQHLFTSAKTLVYVGHLLTSASAVTCIGHNTSHLCQQRYWPAPAKTQVTTLACVRKNTGLRRPQQ